MNRAASRPVGDRSRTYIAIDLKSFYASVECVARGLDPLTTNLVVADVSRTEKTICLAVSPSLKAYGLPGRARLFEVVQKMREVNADRRLRAPGRRLIGESTNANELATNPNLAAGYIAAKPRMAHYLECSANIYGIYLKYAAAEDIHVYSIDEVFIDATRYLHAAGMNAHALARTIVRDILNQTGITATAGIGTNMYLAKVAMDIVAKHMPADHDGVRVAELDEHSYRRLLWSHTPLTDFWRVGRGYAKKLQAHGLNTMGDIARCSLGRASDYYNEDLLYRLFGVNAELLIDHAWGWEPCTIADIKAYRPADTSISSGQVLQQPYDYAHARLVVKEMTDLLVLEMVSKRMETDRVTLAIGYDASGVTARRGNGTGTKNSGDVQTVRTIDGGPTKTDRYGRTVPKPVHGSADLGGYTSSTRRILDAMTGIYDRIVDPVLSVRRITVVVERLHEIGTPMPKGHRYEQLDLFSDDGGTGGDTDESTVGSNEAHGADDRESSNGSVNRPNMISSDASARVPSERREHDIQQSLIDIKRKFGKNAVLKGMNLEKGATGQLRNSQIGGHAA
ncbi:type VI secretion protein ImpB [Bifidobacterium callimiconis]|uniref:Y-family DNA polymerase n=1 Tax=Bifidobacterium callimiconis TaxID=2306973 RepID=UPI001BDD0CA1|nr:type VI secretion protein ImpB [Bifidobacterium callimiconis]MBT1176040.1 type VI secretion protein ImpB [Bifidobacterium callimiconis]